MNQLQFDIIIKLIREGCPLLADELCDAMVKVVVAAQKYEQLNKPCEEVKNNKEEE